mgnify:CR=1 FL=1
MFSFVMEIEGVEFYDALKILAARAGVELVPVSQEQVSERSRLLNLLDDSRKFYESELKKSEAVINYLKERGVTKPTVDDLKKAKQKVKLKEIRKVATKDNNSVMSVTTFHDFVHDHKTSTIPSELKKYWENLPLFAGKVLHRLGLANRVEIDDDAFTRKIEAEQKQRTWERKQAQIERAKRDTKKRKANESSN